MAEYRDRKAAISLIKQYGMDAIDGGRYSLDTVDDCIELGNSIKALPAADVVPVVRCKDCRYLVNATVNSNGFLICYVNDMEIAPDDFCSYGERKEGKDEK